MMQFNLELPAFLASAFVNDDDSGFESADHETMAAAAAEAAAEAEAIGGPSSCAICVGVSETTFIGVWEGQQCEMADFYFFVG